MSARMMRSGGRIVRRIGVFAGLAAAIAAAPDAASAQSLFGSRGLGVVVAPVDGRTAALGGLGIALPGPSPALLNPADAGDARRRGVILTMQPSTTELETEAGSDAVSATRFPLVQVLLPIGDRAVFTAGYGAFLDQNWGATSEEVVQFEDTTVTAVDRVTSRGGVAQARAGLAYRVTDDLTLGASIGMLTGSATRTALRLFEDDPIGLTPFATETKTTYQAPLAGFGARYRIGSAVLVGAGVTWIGDLTRSVGEGEDRTESEVAMPLQVSGGASAQLVDDLLLAVSTRWTSWSATDDLDDASTEDVLDVGGGVEWSGLTTLRRSFPVRIGARWGGQPFSFGGSAPSERAVSFGLGGRLAGSEEVPAALVDFAIERGSRGELEENGIAESFWRATISVSLFSQ